MCGRYRLSRRKETLAGYFGANFADVDWAPRYNISPTQTVPVIRRENIGSKLKTSLMRWGLIPSWSKDARVAGLFNARSETAATKPSFREPLRSQRCLIPADGFYEWKRTGREKQPFCFEVQGGRIFAFAGIWDRWRNPEEKAIETCVILTTSANDLIADGHDLCRSFCLPRTTLVGSEQGRRIARTLQAY